MSKKIDTAHYVMWMENGILCCVYKLGAIITLDIAKKMVRHRMELTNCMAYPCFVDIRNMIAIKSDARVHLAGPEGVKYINAGAIYLDNYLHYLTGLVFLKIDEPAIPSKLFTDKDRAFLWLAQFKNLN